MDREVALRKRQGARLRAARQAAGWSKARPCALENGWPESTYSAHERGSRTIGLDDAERYVRRFQAKGVDITAKSILFEPEELERAESAPNGVTLVPKVSWVSASQLVDVGDLPPMRDAPTLQVADLPPGDWFALDVKGDSMDRVAPDGSTILINRADRRLIRHRFYVFSERGEATFKRYVDKPVRRLEAFSFNPNHDPIYPRRRELTVIGRVRRVLLDL